MDWLPKDELEQSVVGGTNFEDKFGQAARDRRRWKIAPNIGACSITSFTVKIVNNNK